MDMHSQGVVDRSVEDYLDLMKLEYLFGALRVTDIKDNMGGVALLISQDEAPENLSIVEDENILFSVLYFVDDFR